VKAGLVDGASGKNFDTVTLAWQLLLVQRQATLSAR
jgi:hypothetical protein